MKDLLHQGSREKLFPGQPWDVLIGLAQPYARQLLVIGALALLSTAASLLQPFIYRTAINDVAGLFVESATGQAERDVAKDMDASPNPLPDDRGGPGDVSVQTAPVQGSPAQAFAESPSAQPKAPSKLTGKKSTRPAEKKKRSAAGKKDTQGAVQTPTQVAAEPHRTDYIAPRTPQQTLSGLWWAVGLLFATSLITYYLSLMSENRAVALASKIEGDLIRSTFGHVLHLPLGFFSRKSTGALAKQIDQSDQVAPIVSAFSQEIAPEVLRTIGIVVIMLSQSWRLAAVALATLPIYVWISRLAARRLESGMDRYYQMWEGVSARIHDALASVKTVKLSGSEEREAERFQTEARTAYDDYIVRVRVGNRYLFVQLVLSHFSKAAVLGYGGWLVFERRLTPGDVVMFYVYLDRLFDPIDSLSSIAVNLQQNLASLNRAVRLLKTGNAEKSGVALLPGPGEAELRKVSFSYKAGREVLHGISFRAAAGKTTALVGPSGSGKTTIADLLLKLYEPESGEILLDGQSLGSMDPLLLRREIGVVAADGAVFRGTLADNIRYKRPDASDQEVRDAAVAAGLSRLIDDLPDGLQTEVGENGVGLSLGERQRLQIARMLLGRPRLLIFDEATANLDYATETDIKRGLASLPYRPTMIVIAHRYSMVRDADWVVVIENGSIVQQGRPEQLRKGEGWFAKLASQNLYSATEIAG